MALDSAPPVLDPPAGDDVARLRRMAQQQWAARRDLERRLHDGAALRVSALTLRLGLLSHLHPDETQDLRVAVEGLQDEMHLVLQELRDIAGRLYPPLLDEAGLGPALREAAGRYAVPVRIDAPDERFGPDVEGAVYFAVLGCLPDGTATPVEVVVRREADALRVLVSGVDACHAGTVHDGVRLLGGTVEVDESPAGGALITVRIPCA
ncbi:MAG TPA: histidine kinase [Pseudonocardia sp.]|nr:histidine kinase [Pseudonocardia sp.]